MPLTILLQTKFLVPQKGYNLLARPHLIQTITKNLEKQLILISAPAGYGKTTLLIELAENLNAPLVWYQLDSRDSDPNVFISYLMEGLRKNGKGSCV